MFQTLVNFRNDASLIKSLYILASGSVSPRMIMEIFRCINAVIAASEFVRAERKELERQILSQSQSNRNGTELKELEAELQNLEGITSVEVNIKASMKIFIKCASTIILQSWSDSNRYGLFCHVQV
jgi:hypothetical protein